jgi:hypothetical protein
MLFDCGWTVSAFFARQSGAQSRQRGRSQSLRPEWMQAMMRKLETLAVRLTISMIAELLRDVKRRRSQ